MSFLCVPKMYQRRRPQWQRNRSYADPKTREDAKRPKSAGEGPLAAISNATMNKLNIFHFGAHSSVQDEDKTAAKKISFTLSPDDKENAVLEKKQENLDSGVNQLSKFSSLQGSANQRMDAPAT